MVNNTTGHNNTTKISYVIIRLQSIIPRKHTLFFECHGLELLVLEDVTPHSSSSSLFFLQPELKLVEAIRFTITQEAVFSGFILTSSNNLLLALFFVLPLGIIHEIIQLSLTTHKLSSKLCNVYLEMSPFYLQTEQIKIGQQWTKEPQL